MSALKASYDGKMFVAGVQEFTAENGMVSTMVTVREKLSESKLFAKLGVNQRNTVTGTIWFKASIEDVEKALPIATEIPATDAVWGDQVERDGELLENVREVLVA